MKRLIMLCLLLMWGCDKANNDNAKVNTENQTTKQKEEIINSMQAKIETS